MVAPSRTIAITKDWSRLGGQLAILGAHGIAAMLETLAHAADRVTTTDTTRGLGHAQVVVGLQHRETVPAEVGG
jgi:hypothetical protein